MAKINIQIDCEGFAVKPDKKKTIEISRRITENEMEITIEEFADLVGNKGHAFLSAYLASVRKAENFVYQKVFALDFDGTISVDEFLERAECFEIEPAFLYETFTSTNEKHKFRAVFINDVTIKDKEVAEIMIHFLLRLFPEADKSCKDVARMFFGGKKVIYSKYENRINIFNLSLATQGYMKSVDPSNYAKKIRGFAERLNIAVKDNSLCIHRGEDKCKKDEFLENTSIIMVNSKESSFFYVIEKTVKHQTCMRHFSKRENQLIKGVDEKLVIENCKLCKEFFRDDLPHEQKFMIATNLRHVNGGRKMFFKAPIESVEKWEIAWKYMENFQYKPECCKAEICPHFESCHGITILDKITSKIQKIESYEYEDVKNSEQLLKQYLKTAISYDDGNIHLIKAQTAIGKTSTYCDIISKTKDKTFMIVLPTNILQEEVAAALENKGVDTYVTPNIKMLTAALDLNDLCEEIEELYSKGYGQKVKPRIREYIENETIEEWKKDQLEKYLNMKEQFNGKKCIVTTHALFLGLEAEVLQQYEIIVDEDILMTIFKNTSSLSFRELDVVLDNVNIDKRCAQRILELESKEDGSVWKYEKLKLQSEEVEEIYKQKLNINGSIVDFLQADTYHVDLQNERVDFFNVRKLPDVKMIVVSATLIDRLYMRFCGYRSIRFYEVPIAKYKGELKQYTAHSLSRSNMEQIGMDELNKGIQAVIHKPDIAQITFKKFSEEKEHYYGNTEGLNIYKGKDIAVIGTPHSIPFIYMLIGKYLGFNTDDKLCQRFVEHNGYRFKFMTYGDEDMRMLQFYIIESAIEQTIGRARLLRFPCIVYLFSNFPVRQAEIIQEDYLKECDSEAENKCILDKKVC